MVTGGSIMIVEILGAKLLAPYFGTSTFVWTAQITMTLLALAGGYAVGGWLADRTQRLGWIYGGIMVAALWLALVTLLRERIAYSCLGLNLAVGSLLASLILFLVPLAALAMVGPFFVRVLTSDLAAVGGSVGRLTALSTLGSVLGTLLIGYLLIPLMPNTTTLFAVAGLLIAVALVYFGIWERRRFAPAGAAGVVALICGFSGLAAPSLRPPAQFVEVARRNSSFGMMQVADANGGQYRMYLNDLLVQNTYNPKTGQSQSLFSYMLLGLMRSHAPASHDVLCIGMGVGIVPMQLAGEGARVDVVEINPAVVTLAQDYFGFDPTNISLTIGDGRHFAMTTTNRYDAVVLDAFLGESPPSHLMTREAFAAIQRCLRPGGVLVMNAFGDFMPGQDFLVGSLHKTLQAVFQSVRLHAAETAGTGNVFLVASDRASLTPMLPMDIDAIPFFLQGKARAAFAGSPRLRPEAGIVLTDDYNPVEFYDAHNRESLRRALASDIQHP